MSVVNKKISLCFIAVFVSCVSSAQDEEVEPRRVTIKGPPSANYNSIPDQISPMSFSFLCSDDRWGYPLPCKFEYEYLGYGSEDDQLDCVIDTSGPLPTVEQGTCVSGGHSNKGARPETFNNSTVELVGTEDEDPGSSTVKGTQPLDFGGYRIVVQAPEASGYYSWKFNVKTPVGWRFNGNKGITENKKQLFISGKNIVRVKDLYQLPESEFYVKARNPSTYHSNENAFFATVPMLEAMAAFSLEYRRLSGDENLLISFNDVSLPLGGLFDIHGNWSPPHSTHREGLDVDLNRTPGNAPEGYEIPACPDDRLLHEAARNVLTVFSPLRSSPVLCESGNRRHLDYTPTIQSTQAE